MKGSIIVKVGEIIDNNSVWIPNPYIDQDKPIVSVLLPTFSRAHDGYLKNCIDSVLGQSFSQLELIIIVDGSTDGTMDICKEYMKKDSRVHLIWHEKNLGLPAISTYEAYMRARGDYIAFAFDDNVWEMDALRKTINYMKKNGVKASYGITSVINPISGKSVQIGANEENVETFIFFGNQIGAGSVVLHRTVLETVGLHDPHLSLTRVCDWDLWLRVMERFKFVATNILFASEKGTVLSDSLGNAFKLDMWFYKERQQMRNIEQFLPNYYFDIDITECSSSNSEYYHKCMESFYLQYEKKYWFDKSTLEYIQQDSYNYKLKRIVVVTNLKSASEMNFARYEGNDYVISFCIPSAVNISMLAAADVCIYSRILPNTSDIKVLTSMLSIPLYYFVDDNFVEISSENNDPVAKAIANSYTEEFFAPFKAIIVTTEHLRRFFEERKLHKRVLVLPPVWKEPKEKKEKSHPLTIGYMGGSFRDDIIESCILPALKAISKDYPLRFVYPVSQKTKEQAKDGLSDGLEFIPFERTINYEFAINTYDQIGIDIFIHCGGNNKNNIYKTKNALLNAVSLSAPLIVSDIEPYRDLSDGSENTYLLVDNCPNEWEFALRGLIEYPDRRGELLQNACAFCRDHYCSAAAWEELDRELAKIPNNSVFQYFKRIEKYNSFYIFHSQQGVSGFTMHPKRTIAISDLVFSNEIHFPRRYGITATADRINEIDLLFGVNGICVGNVIIRLLGKRNELLGSTACKIDELCLCGYSVFRFNEPIDLPYGEIIKVEIDIDYKEKCGYIGLYEDRKKRTFIYKVCNKLGFPIHGKNALIADMGYVL